MHNPYEPPRADLIDKRKPPGSLLKAVVVGVAIDLGGTTVVSFLAVVVYAALLTSRGQTTEQIQQSVDALVPWSGFGLILAALGCLMSMLAGYQSAAIANRTNYLAPGILSAISTGVGAYAGGRTYSAWVLSVLSGITVAMTLSGAWLYMRQVARRA
jgi:hypothetical protein